jgi:gliding motility-associated-like protein
MKRLFQILLFIFSFQDIIEAQQNLVPNWSFENINSCPTSCLGITTETLAVGWLNPNNGSPDLFNSCDIQICGGGWNIPCLSVPSNCPGWQNPHSGLGYVGFAVYGDAQANVREYIQIKLLDSLSKNKKYCSSMFVSLADSESRYATSRIGSYFSQTQITNFSQYLISATPQIESPPGQFLTDKINWVEIKGIYTASGGENYLTIGNFHGDATTDTTSVLPWRFGSTASYYYIDDVSLVEIDSAFAGVDTSLCLEAKLKRKIPTTFGAQYNWTILNGDFNSMDSNTVASPGFNPTVTTTYIVEKKQCGITSYDTLVIHVPKSYPVIVPNDTTICLGDSLILTVRDSCVWCNHGWNAGVSSTQIKIAPQNTSSYTYYQKDSCSTTSKSVRISVEQCYSPQIIVPNVFTPNDDGINDVWFPTIHHEESVRDYTLTIFDRWGLKIFESHNTQVGWAGHTTGGLAASEGTYFFVINFYDSVARFQKNLKGFIQLIR